MMLIVSASVASGSLNFTSLGDANTPPYFDPPLPKQIMVEDLEA